jgi:DNA-binding NarL/FixJ family response regulator
MRTPQTSLSPREIEVLERVAAGSGKGARELVITEQTVESHVVHIYTKLGVSSTAAVSLARERGILRS